MSALRSILRSMGFPLRSATKGSSGDRAGGVFGYLKTHTATRLPELIESVVRSSRDGYLRTAFERTNPLAAHAVRIFARGLRAIFNLCRAFEAAGKPSFLSLIHLRQKSLSVLSILFRPSPFVAAIHAHTKAWSSPNEVQRKPVPGA